MNTEKTAILIFANSSQEESKRKTIEQAHTLFHKLNQHTLRIVEKTALPYFLFTEKKQQGSTFGERFVNALQTIFDKGFEKIIAIGNDAPQLTSKDLLYSALKLQHNDCILGPSHDGGFYLIGLHKDSFDTHFFLELPWQTQDISRRICQHFRISKTAILSTLIDIDTVQDLKRISNFHKSITTALLQCISKILSHFKTLWETFSKQYSFIFLSDLFNKGSPILN